MLDNIVFFCYMRMSITKPSKHVFCLERPMEYIQSLDISVVFSVGTVIKDSIFCAEHFIR